MKKHIITAVAVAALAPVAAFAGTSDPCGPTHFHFTNDSHATWYITSISASHGKVSHDVDFLQTPNGFEVKPGETVDFDAKAPSHWHNGWFHGTKPSIAGELVAWTYTTDTTLNYLPAWRKEVAHFTYSGKPDTWVPGSSFAHCNLTMEPSFTFESVPNPNYQPGYFNTLPPAEPGYGLHANVGNKHNSSIVQDSIGNFTVTD